MVSLACLMRLCISVMAKGDLLMPTSSDASVTPGASSLKSDDHV